MLLLIENVTQGYQVILQMKIFDMGDFWLKGGQNNR